MLYTILFRYNNVSLFLFWHTHRLCIAQTISSKDCNNQFPYFYKVSQLCFFRRFFGYVGTVNEKSFHLFAQLCKIMQRFSSDGIRFYIIHFFLYRSNVTFFMFHILKCVCRSCTYSENQKCMLSTFSIYLYSLLLICISILFLCTLYV